METTFFCNRCKQEKTHESDVSTGYGTMPNGEKHCFDCCAVNDKEQMIKNRKTTALYIITNKNGEKEVINWPGTLRFPLYGKTKKSTIYGFCHAQRTDFWFIFNGYIWHGINRGDMDCARCYQTKTQFINGKEVRK